MPNIPSVTLLTEPKTIEASLPALRQQLLAALDTPDSATGLAKRLQGLTRQQINYHLRELERAGLVRLFEQRQRRGLTERIMARTTDVMLVDPTVLIPEMSHHRDRAGIAGIIGAARDALRAVTQLAAGAAQTKRRLSTATLQTTVRLAKPSDLSNLVRDFAELCASYEASGSEVTMSYQITIMAYPQLQEELDSGGR